VLGDEKFKRKELITYHATHNNVPLPHGGDRKYQAYQKQYKKDQ